MRLRNPFRQLAAAMAVALLLIPAGGAMAEPSDALRAHRVHVLAATDAHMAALGDIATGKVALFHHAVDHAVAIVGSSRGLLELFPEKVAGLAPRNGNAGMTGDGARPTAFQSAAVTFNEQAARMVQLAMGGAHDPVARQFEVLREAYAGLRKHID